MAGGYRFFGGKGGTGKTTCAAAAAIAAAETGQRVLVVSTDPAHSLGDGLAMRLGPRPRRVATRRGRLEAVELDADRALARWLAPRERRLRAIAERGTYLDAGDVRRLLRLSLPGVDELVALVELTRLARAGRYQQVVVDTAPTGHTLRLLTMPETLVRIAGVLDAMYAKHRFLAEHLGGHYRPDAGDALIAELQGEGQALHTLLRDPARCAFSWVLLPEALAVEETRDGVRELGRAGIRVRDVVVNRVWPPSDPRCPRCAAKARAEAQAIRVARAALSGRPLRLVPALPREPRGVAALRRVADHLAGAGEPDGRRAAAHPVTRPRVRGRLAGPVGPPARWREVVAPAGTRLVLVVGKGGEGKTTCATAIGLALAEAPSRPSVLLLSTDPAHSLGDVLAQPVGDRERAVPGAPAGLRVRELDAPRAFHERRARYRAAVAELFGADRADRGVTLAYDRAVVEELVDLAPPGVDELFAVLAVTEALEGPGRQHDVVVVDTAPTGHTLRLLALPGAALEWVRALLAVLLKYRAVLRPGRLAADLLALAADLRRLGRLLRDARRTRVVVVTRPGELPRQERCRLAGGLARLGLDVTAVIANALPVAGPGACARCARAAAEARRAVTALGPGGRRGRGRRLLLAPEAIPPPRGVGPLRRWSTRWALA